MASTGPHSQQPGEVTTASDTTAACGHDEKKVSSEGCVILKARNDERQYRKVVLTNELQVLLVSDPATDKAAASMNVNVGSFSDPDGLEGLAHFLEHMLFFSSEKYPVEDSYCKFLAEHGGHSNAFTGPESTNFHFDVNVDHLEEALDRFAQFFICPLFSADAVSREINAVNSENSKNLVSDPWRTNQLWKAISSQDHPYHKFGTGNIETLDVLPKKRGVDTREELLKFYHRHYSANLMRLIVYGKESLDELQKVVSATFSLIENLGKEAPSFSGQPCLPEHLQIIVKSVPVRLGHYLELVWPIPPQIKNYKTCPSRYLGHLVGHEAKGSLFALLKDLGWANSLSAGEVESAHDFSFVMIQIELTDLGQEHMSDVVGYAFQYLAILQRDGVAEWIFEEVKAVCEMKFHYQDKRPPVSYVTGLAGNMLLYPPEDWLTGPYLVERFDPEAIRDLIDHLTVQNVRIFWHSQQFEGKTTEIEPWYGTPYSMEKVDTAALNRWSSQCIDPRLELPLPNLFIPTDFSLLDVDSSVKFPTLVRRSSLSRLWYKPDPTFRTPKAHIQFDFHCPEANFSPETSILTRIFTNLLLDYLNEVAYYAEVAGLSYDIQNTVTGFRIAVSGYNDKLTTLVERIMQKLVEFEVKEERFAFIKEKVMKDLLNFKFQQPYQQVLYYASMLMEHKRWHINEYTEVLPSLEAKDLEMHYCRALSRMFFEGYAGGNIPKRTAEDLVENMERMLQEGPKLRVKAAFASQHLEHRVVRLEAGSDFLYPIAGLNMQDENSALLFYLQVSKEDVHMNVLLDLFVLIAKREVFHQLRSVEQLGYIVALLPRNDFGIRGVQFIIQSSVKDPIGLDERVEAFLEMIESTLQSITEAEFQKHVDALKDIKLEKHKNIWEESNFFWKEIEFGTLLFDRAEVEVAALQKTTRQDLLRLYDEHVQRSGSKRSKLSVQVYGSLHTKELQTVMGSDASSADCPSADLPEKPYRIEDMHSFKRSQGLFGSFKGGLTEFHTQASSRK